ncbi:MAG: futalosine hydrolase [Desulfobulbaceae bacterium]|nr:futalosine hydrolase [Desulfobulbaceae bacterium]
MFLLVTATEQEMQPLTERLAETPGWLPFVAGVGCLETAVNLTRFLSETSIPIQAVINCGIAGAFVDSGPGLLDICLAQSETQADVGVWMASGIIDFDTIHIPTQFPLSTPLRTKAQAILSAHGQKPWIGPFVSVLAVSGTLNRGETLRTKHQAICENMEGASVARIALDFQLPCLEIRSISNMVIDRDLSQWQLASAIQRLAQTMAILLPELLAQP